MSGRSISFSGNGFKRNTSLTIAALNTYLQAPRIFHVHGQLGLLAFQEGKPEQRLDYGRRLTTDIVRKAADGIRIPHDDGLGNSLAYKQAVDRVEEANTIVFLGFGFDEQNLQRLQVPIIDDSNRLIIYGTTYGMSGPEQQRVLKIAGKWNDMAGSEITTRGFLDNFWPKLRAANAISFTTESRMVTCLA